jgi:hypothetical protein
MMESLPIYVWLIVLIGVIGIPAATVVGLYRGLRANLDRRGAVVIASVVLVVWAAWIVLTAVLTDDGAYRQSTTTNRPWIGVAAGGALLAALLGSQIPSVRRAVKAPGMLARLTWPHTFRILGIVFVITMALGKLPALFALPAGLGDIAIGIAAPFVARRLAAGDRRGAVWFNVMGLLDLVVAVSIGFLAGLGPTRILEVSPSTAAVALLPLALIPTTAVPMAACLHIVSLIRLRATRRVSVPVAVTA